jgi:hypothetical protein
MFKIFLSLAILLQGNQIFNPSNVPVARQKIGEVEYTKIYAEKLFEEYELEYQLPDGRRVDILTKTHAFESEWIYKFNEAIGQSLGYALSTNKNPGILILYKNGYDEQYNQLLTVVTSLRDHGYKINLIIINVDNGKIWNALPN